MEITLRFLAINVESLRAQKLCVEHGSVH